MSFDVVLLFVTEVCGNNKRTHCDMARRIVFTANNYDDATEDMLARCYTDKVFSYMVYGREVAPTTGTPHLQGYAELTKQTRITTIRKLMKGIHVVLARGNVKANFAYCTKDNDYVEMGEATQQGQRSDLVAVMTAIDDGRPLEWIRKSYPADFIRYRRAITDTHALVNTTTVVGKFAMSTFAWPPLSLERSVVLWGASGIGKTQFALAHFRCPLWVNALEALDRFDVDKHDGIVFDDMSFIGLSHEQQIAVVDHEDDRSINKRFKPADIPGGTKKIFTTNVVDGRIFDWDDEAVARRCRVVHLTGTSVPSGR